MAAHSTGEKKTKSLGVHPSGCSGGGHRLPDPLAAGPSRLDPLAAARPGGRRPGPGAPRGGGGSARPAGTRLPRAKPSRLAARGPHLLLPCAEDPSAWRCPREGSKGTIPGGAEPPPLQAWLLRRVIRPRRMIAETPGAGCSRPIRLVRCARAQIPLCTATIPGKETLGHVFVPPPPRTVKDWVCGRWPPRKARALAKFRLQGGRGAEFCPLTQQPLPVDGYQCCSGEIRARKLGSAKDTQRVAPSSSRRSEVELQTDPADLLCLRPHSFQTN